MGKLLSLLARDESTCCTPQKYDVFLDFESKYDEYTRVKMSLSIVVSSCWIFLFFPAFLFLFDDTKTWQNVVRYRDVTSDVDQRSTFALENHSRRITVGFSFNRIFRCTTFRHRKGDLWSGAKSSEKFRIYLRGDSVLQRGRERNQRGDFGAHGGVSTESLPDCCPSGCQAEKILWIFIRTWWALTFHIFL